MKVSDPRTQNAIVAEPEDANLSQLRLAAIKYNTLLTAQVADQIYLVPPRLALSPKRRDSFHRGLTALQDEIGFTSFDQEGTTAFVTSNEYDANSSIKSLFSAECSNLPQDKLRVAILVGSSNLPSMLPELLKHADIVLFCDRNPLMLEHNHFNIEVLRSSKVGLDYLNQYFDDKKNPWLTHKVQTGLLGEYVTGTDQLISKTESRKLDAATLQELTVSYLATAFKTTNDEEDEVNCAFLPNEDRFHCCVLAAKMLSFQGLTIDLFDQVQVKKLSTKLEELNAVVTVCNVSSLYYYDAPTNFSPIPKVNKALWKCTGNLLRSLQLLTTDETYILFSQYKNIGSGNLYSQFTRGWKNFMASMIANVKQLNVELVPAEILALARDNLTKDLNAALATTQEPVSKSVETPPPKSQPYL